MEPQYILIIENSLMNRHKISEILNKDKINVKYANSAEEALKILVKSNPYLLAMDMYLPRLNAHTLGSILKNDENTSDIKIVAFSNQLFNNPVVSPFDCMIHTNGKEYELANGIKTFLKTVKPISTLIIKKGNHETNY